MKHKSLLENRKKVLETIITNLTYSCNVIEKFSGESQTFELGMTEDMYFFENQKEDEFIINEEKRQMSNGCFEQLHACVPAFYCSYQNPNSIIYGYGMLTKDIEPDLASLGVYIGNQQCFHGFVKVKDRRELYQKVFEQIAHAETIYEIKCSSKIYGRMHHEEKASDHVTWYYEVWALIEG